MGRVKKNCALVLWCFLLCFNSVSFADELTAPVPQEDILLKPEMRAEELSKAVYVIKTDIIAPYLINIVMFDRPADFEDLPYIIGFDQEVSLAAVGDIAYATGIKPNENMSTYSILRSLKPFDKKNDKNSVGLGAFIIGSAEMQASGEPQTLRITDATEYIPIGARLVPRIGLDLPAILEAKIPNKPMTGRILYVENESLGVGKNSVAIINLGQRDGLRQGDLLSILEIPKQIKNKKTDKQVVIKERKFGEIVIYKVMDKTSLGFVVDATRAVLVGDKVTAAQRGS